ncbi:MULTISPECIES: hypothetical protein [Streptomyces]|nr:hypothetical protein [Streptomyces sp. SID7805]
MALLAVNGDTAAIEGTGRHKELWAFADLWTVTFDKNAKCTIFLRWNDQV